MFYLPFGANLRKELSDHEVNFSITIMFNKVKEQKCHLKMSWPFTDFSDPRSIFISTVDCICNTSLNSNLILLVRSKDYEYQLLVCF